ncbi:hypothetical protein Fcan01_16280 [Folsomia candida]|uniref:Death domain-containing protein n=1 Tax=Folsomia candida TaxID=158441 RepID=A0A226DSW3_FOLCA|nr:hypothetical protein Fcan01_16280 [Folsomia candida]
MNPGTISNLASHLASDSYLTRRRSEIADCLEVSGGRRVQLGDLFQSGSYTPYEYFYELLEEWVGKKGPSATLEELAKIMRERQFNAFAASKEQVHCRMNPLIISDFVSHLVEDGYVTRRRCEFADCLRVPRGWQEQLELGFTSGSLDPYKYFKSLLEEWAGQNGSSATPRELARIMGEKKFNLRNLRLFS